jgi:hypothetical protein
MDEAYKSRVQRPDYGSRYAVALIAALLAFLLNSLGSGSVEASERPDRKGTPDWDLPLGFESDVFLFRRIKYRSARSYGPWGYDKWAIDYPDAEINMSYRMQQLTSIRTHPDGDLITLRDPLLFDSPFIYVAEPGDLVLDDDEVDQLRNYLTNGGFLLADDFWGDREWYNFEEQIRRVFPDRKIVDLPLDHQVFNCVFTLKALPQVPNVRTGHYSQWTGVTWEEDKMPGAKDPHYRAIFDERGRMMVMICHNTDNGDGWEQEGASEYFFKEFSEKQSYPLGINILFYALTH